MLLVLGRAALVGDRAAVLGGDSPGLREGVVGRRAAAQELLGLWRREVPGTDCRQADAGRLDCGLAGQPASSSQTETPAAATGQSPTRRPTFSYALPAPGLIAIRISVRISAGATTVS